MKRYDVTLTGLTDLLMHSDDVSACEKVTAWRKDPANKINSVNGDDRSPPWTWTSYLYHDGSVIGIPADNLMTMLREGGSKILTGKRTETYKKHTQSGIVIDTFLWPLTINGATIDVESVNSIIDETEFNDHEKFAQKNGFELFVKRAKIGAAKHIRVRPRFRAGWKCSGQLTVIDEKQSGLTISVLKSILNQCGSLVGIGDWRPSSKFSSGCFGKFSASITVSK